MIEKDKYTKAYSIIEELEINSRVRQIQDNSEKLKGYWGIGKLIYEASKKKETTYGKRIIEEWSKKLVITFGKGYDNTNLSRFKRFYIYFPIFDAMRQQLTWTHYRQIIQIKNENERNYYINKIITKPNIFITKYELININN